MNALPFRRQNVKLAEVSCLTSRLSETIPKRAYGKAGYFFLLCAGWMRSFHIRPGIAELRLHRLPNILCISNRRVVRQGLGQRVGKALHPVCCQESAR